MTICTHMNTFLKDDFFIYQFDISIHYIESIRILMEKYI